MRLFVSVDLDGLGTDIAEIQESFEDVSGLRLTDSEQAHVTLKFLGETDEDRLPTLTDELQAAVDESGVDSFDATFEGLGVFPHLEYISVVWLGVKDGSKELTRLHEHIEERMTAIGFEPEDHDFTPHATLARMDHAGGKEHVQEVVSNKNPTAGTIRVDEVRLTESVLSERGPEYTTVERFTL